MSGDVCEMSDLPVEMCSHCRGLDAKPEKRPAVRITEARWPGRCLNCDEWIRLGDRIGLVDGDWLCERCFS